MQNILFIYYKILKPRNPKTPIDYAVAITYLIILGLFNLFEMLVNLNILFYTSLLFIHELRILFN